MMMRALSIALVLPLLAPTAHANCDALFTHQATISQAVVVGSNRDTAYQITQRVDPSRVQTKPETLALSETECQPNAKAAEALATLYFYLDQTQMTPASERQLNALAAQLANQNNIQLVGHADSQGNHAYNLNLGLARANATKSKLLGLGVKGKIQVDTRGDSKPAQSNLDAQGRAANRRVEIYLN